MIDLLPDGRVEHVHHETVLLAREDDFLARLRRILHTLAATIERFLPQEAAIEQVFLARNADSALKLGQARGAALSALVLAGLPVAEYAPMQIKQAVVGTGAAEKHQVQQMVRVLLSLPAPPPSDAADALAVAIAHAHVRQVSARARQPGLRLARRRGRMLRLL